QCGGGLQAVGRRRRVVGVLVHGEGHPLARQEREGGGGARAAGRLHHAGARGAQASWSSRTRRLIRASIADIPRIRSGETSWVSPKRSGRSSGTSRTCWAGSPSRPSCRIDAKPRVVGASAGAEKNSRTGAAGPGTAPSSHSTV